MPRSRSPRSAGCPNSPRAWSATCAPAGRWRKPGSTIGCGLLEPAAAARISAGAAVRPGAVLQRRQGARSSRAAQSSNISARHSESAAAARSAGQISRDPVDLCRAEQRRAAILNLLLDRRVLSPARNGRSCAGRAPSEFAKLKLKRVSDWLGDKRVARGRPLHHRRPDDGHGAAASCATPTSSPNSPTRRLC